MEILRHRDGRSLESKDREGSKSWNSIPGLSKTHALYEDGGNNDTNQKREEKTSWHGGLKNEITPVMVDLLSVSSGRFTDERVGGLSLGSSHLDRGNMRRLVFICLALTFCFPSLAFPACMPH